MDPCVAQVLFNVLITRKHKKNENIFLNFDFFFIMYWSYFSNNKLFLTCMLIHISISVIMVF